MTALVLRGNLELYYKDPRRRRGLICRSDNHKGIGHLRGIESVITRCVRCGKPTCSTCEGTDNGFKDICDRCWHVLHDYIELLKKLEDNDTGGKCPLTRAVIRRWARKGQVVSVYKDYDLYVPEPHG